ncbi:MAG: ABC-2 type transport system permease protein [Patiriisocius sp.]|jgi:ABC-2 type transport system permease protein
MLALYKKEIWSFLSSLIGYIVIVVFLLMTGLFMWIFPGEMNQIDRGFADLDTLFLIGPWVFMFLIPAITMRSFSEERRTGTMELLLTKPLSKVQIILAKFFSGLTLTVIAIIPTLFYYYSINKLGLPEGNIDHGGVWGSYLGLIFLSAVFVSIGMFASSLTSNQIVAFITAVFLSFFLFFGFESIASFDLLGSFDSWMLNIGIKQHYSSMSRGVIDTRDVAYFVGVSAIFILLTKFNLETGKQ